MDFNHHVVLHPTNKQTIIMSHNIQVVRDNPDDVARYQAGKKRLKQFFVGEIMKQTKGRAHPKAINELLDKYLSSPQQ